LFLLPFDPVGRGKRNQKSCEPTNNFMIYYENKETNGRLFSLYVLEKNAKSVKFLCCRGLLSFCRRNEKFNLSLLYNFFGFNKNASQYFKALLKKVAVAKTAQEPISHVVF